MFKLDLEKTEEQEIIIERAREFQKNMYFSFFDYAKAMTVWTTTNWKILKEMGIPDHLTCLSSTLAWKIPWTEEPDRL